MLASTKFQPRTEVPMLFFLEDRERYNDCTKVAQFMVHMDQQGVFLQVTGLILGHYFTDQFSADMGKYQILVVLCDDFWP